MNNRCNTLFHITYFSDWKVKANPTKTVAAAFHLRYIDVMLDRRLPYSSYLENVLAGVAMITMPTNSYDRLGLGE